MSRVLLVGKGAPDRGGIPSFLEMLRHGELSRQHEVTFLNVAHAGTPQGGRATASNLGRTVRDAVSVWRAARGHDIVHIHSALAPTVTVARAALLALAGRLGGCAVIVHAHGGDVEYWLVSDMRRRLMRWCMRPAARVVAVWSIGERVLRESLGPERVRLIDNGVDIDAFYSDTATRHRPRILYVGLLTARKGVLDLLEASRLLQERGVDHEVHLIGGTPDEGPDAELPVRAAAAAASHAELLGRRPPEQMPPAYADADIFCLPSWWEAMPLSILEAMASSLPVVATDVGDVPREVVQNETGLVVPMKSPQQLADALESLVTNAERRQAMGAAGRTRVEELFSSAATTRQIGELYAEVLREGRQ